MPNLRLFYGNSVSKSFDHCETCPVVDISTGSVHRFNHFLLVVTEFTESPNVLAREWNELNGAERTSLYGMVCGAAVCSLCVERPISCDVLCPDGDVKYSEQINVRFVG